jgi:hypothetical protein
MPAYLLYLLQPLDIGCFAVLKRVYGRLVENQARTGYNYIDKLNFLIAYLEARVEAYKPETIQNSFTVASLVLINVEYILSKLNISLRTPIPPGSRLSSRLSVFIPQTLYNII